jgi:hypothetical protein
MAVGNGPAVTSAVAVAMLSARHASAARHADPLNVCFGKTRPSALGRTETIDDQTEIGQKETDEYFLHSRHSITLMVG